MKTPYKNSFKNMSKEISALTVYRVGFQQCDWEYHRGEEVRLFYMLHYVISGKGSLRCNGHVHEIAKGDAFILFPHTPVDHWVDPKDPYELCWVGFNGLDAHMLVSAMQITIDNPVVHLKQPQSVLDHIRDIFDSRGRQPMDSLQMTGKFYFLVAHMFWEAQMGRNLGFRPSDKHLQTACDYIANYFSQPITVEEIAGHVGISRSRLYRIFMQHTSTSPQKYLMDYRIHEACQRLRAHPSTIKEVAAAVGFTDPLYFSTVFKQAMGQSPTTYLKTYSARKR